jgi:hypothetical protein
MALLDDVEHISVVGLTKIDDPGQSGGGPWSIQIDSKQYGQRE